MKKLFQLAVVAALAAAAWFYYERFARVPSTAELAALRREHQALSDRLGQRLALEAEPADVPPASLVVAVPVPFAERFAQDAAARLLQEATLTLRGLKVEKTGVLQAGMFGELGEYSVHLQLDEVSAVLRAGRPALASAAPQLRVALPLHVLKGQGRGRLRFRWDGRGVGGVCGDFEITGGIAGKVVPTVYNLRARLTLATEGSTLVARPELQDAVLTLNVEPSADTWKLLDDTLAARPAVCRTALAAADVPEKVRALVARGFPVKLPPNLMPAIRFPLEMEKAIDVEGSPIRFQVRPEGIRVAATRVWYRADVRVLGKEEAAAPELTPDATAEPTATPMEAPLEGETDAEPELLVVRPVPEEHLEVRPQPDHH